MNVKFDHNILIGFFTSIANFSREALERMVEFVDLGRDEKLILHEVPDEQLFGACIVETKDNDELVHELLNKILQEFIAEFGPYYNPENIYEDRMDLLVDDILKGKTSYSLVKRFLVSWVILGPLAVILTFAGIAGTEYFLNVFYSGERLFTQNEIFTRLMPQMAIFAFLVLIIVFGITNLFSGYITLDLRIGFLNSIIYIIVVIISYVYSVQPVFAFIILAYSPLVFMISFGATYIGYRLAVKKKLLK
jgi:hypothetical protein